MEKRIVAIRGMHCAACSARIERAVGMMPGVSRAAVNLADETMSLTHDPHMTDLAAVAQRVRELGFEMVAPDPAGRVHLVLGGMHCAACAARIEKAVGAMPGVTGVRVNLASETAQVDIASPGLDAQAVMARIAQLGFTASLLDEGESQFAKRQQEQAQRLEAMRKALAPQLILAGLVLVVAMGPMVGMPVPAFMAPETSPRAYAVIQLVLAAPLLWLGRRFFTDGVPALLRGAPTMDSLISLGSGAAFAASLTATVRLLADAPQHHLVHQLYYESAAVIIALVSLGKYFEAKSKARAAEAVKALLQLTPDTTVRLTEDGQETVPVSLVRVGDKLLVRPGERVAVDGEVLEGSSEVDESMLTGESVPVAKAAGDPLSAGTYNSLGALVMRASKVGGDTVLARIVRLVREAQGSKAPIAGLADKVSLFFVPVVIGIALAAGLTWLLAGETAGFALGICVAVLVIACPCAMGLATPTSIMVGTGRGASLGVLIKSGGALEAASHVDTVVFDKTGTLTMGEPVLTDAVAAQGTDAGPVLRLAAAVEARSAHPLGKAVVRAALERRLEIPEAVEASAVPGRGVTGRLQGAAAERAAEDVRGWSASGAPAPGPGGAEVLVGTAQWLEESGAGVPPDLLEQGEALSGAGKTPLYVAYAGRAIGLLGVADAIRPEARAVVGEMAAMGLRVLMLTGDNQRTADAVAAQAGVKETHARVTPEGKAAAVRQLRAEGRTVAMIGDGINDAPALAAADVGISMGSGLDVAIETGDIVLMRPDLLAAVTAFKLARATVRNIRQNLFWAFAYNVLGIPVAAGVLHAFGGPVLSPMIAGAAMAASSVSVVGNALRLKNFKG